MHAEVIFYHGWGFDSSAWNGWVRAFARDRETSCLHAERGYFGAATSSPQFSGKSTNKIVVTHSLGLHFVPSQVIQAADTLLVFSGFLRFGSSRVIRAMNRKLDQDATAVLLDFWHNCYSPHMLSAKNILRPQSVETDQLRADLKLLDHSVIDPAIFNNIPNILIVQAGQDLILDANAETDLIEALPHAVVYKVAEASHALPFTHVQTSLEILNQARSRNHRQQCQHQ